MSGDMNIGSRGVGAGLVNNPLPGGAIDANSKYGGDFTESRNVDGEVVYLTAEGARVYDEAQRQLDAVGGDRDLIYLSASQDPGFFNIFTKKVREDASTTGSN